MMVLRTSMAQTGQTAPEMPGSASPQPPQKAAQPPRRPRAPPFQAAAVEPTKNLQLRQVSLAYFQEVSSPRDRRPASIAKAHPEVEEVGMRDVVGVDPWERNLVLEVDCVVPSQRDQGDIHLRMALNFHHLPFVLANQEMAAEMGFETAAIFRVALGGRGRRVPLRGVSALPANCLEAVCSSSWRMTLESCESGTERPSGFCRVRSCGFPKSCGHGSFLA